jgi:3,4-dihydroxy 2-butanone 4-phosphate synthase/GTP cyclohydrolase II
VLYDLGVRQMRLLTNNPSKRVGLEGYGLQIVDRVPLSPTVNAENRDYLDTKRLKMGHLLEAFDEVKTSENEDGVEEQTQ